MKLTSNTVVGFSCSLSGCQFILVLPKLMVLLLCAVIHEFVLSRVVANVESRIARQDELYCCIHVSIQQENLLSKLSAVSH